jgi:hypothetical protein
VRQNIGRPHPARWCEHDGSGGAQRLANAPGLLDQNGAWNTARQHVRILIHRQDGHPVRDVGRDAHPAIELPHAIS